MTLATLDDLVANIGILDNSTMVLLSAVQSVQVASASDRAQSGLDRLATAADRLTTASDRLAVLAARDQIVGIKDAAAISAGAFQLDGGFPESLYGGTTPINGGTI